MINEKLLKSDERALLTLRSLYRAYGYLPFKMSKFEEYDLYVRNKDFLVSDGIITFTDTAGKLLALKPDVTLSIIKNGADEKGCKQKVYYNENVYRTSGETRQYKEIMQAGLECIGDVGVYDLFEVLLLAAKSLASISENYVLEISHMGILAGLLEDISDDEGFSSEIAKCVKEKNVHEIATIGEKYGISEEKLAPLCEFVGIYGSPASVIERLTPLCKNDMSRAALDTLKTIASLFEGREEAANIRFDFSTVNDMHYYSGIVFGGYLYGIPESVLSGGQYGRLMAKMGRRADAVGFAIYLDLLEGLGEKADAYDVDVLLIADENADPKTIASSTEAFIKEGKTVSVQSATPEKLRYRELVTL